MAIVGNVLEKFDEVIRGGDPEFQQWFLLESVSPVLVIFCCYVLLVKVLGPAFMKNRKPIRFPYMLSAYNFLIVCFYSYFLLHGMYFMPKLGLSFICGSLSHPQGPIMTEFFRLGWRFYMIKYVELIDTVFMVLSKKFNMITNLHVFHHAIVPVFIFISFRSETSAYISVFAALNSIVHVFMYTYYGIAALGPEYQKYIWWKKYLTSLQILQFLSMNIYLIFMYAIGCCTSKATLVFCFCLSVAFTILFINFYKKAFTQPGKTHSLQNDCARTPNISASVQQKRTQFINGEMNIKSSEVNGGEKQLILSKDESVDKTEQDKLQDKVKSL